jgi:hypothetical protein
MQPRIRRGPAHLLHDRLVIIDQAMKALSIQPDRGQVDVTTREAL